MDIEFLDVRIGDLNKVIEGNVSALDTAFLYEATPQGRSYWADICIGHKRMTHKDLEYLKRMRDEYNAQNTEKENIMYVLVAINAEQMPILIQADSLESLNEQIFHEYGDWEEFSNYYNDMTGYSPEDLFSLWKLENGALVRQSFVIHVKPVIVL